MKISNLLRKIHKPNSQIKPERTSYGIKFIIPESLTEDELLKSFVRIPTGNYKLPDEQGIVLDFAGRACSRRLILHMLNSIVWEKGIKIIAWLSSNDDSLKLFRAAGLCVNEPAPDIIAQVLDAQEKNKELKIVYNSLRSGQRVETEGDVLVWGHLNPGAEIVAGGSIIIAGKLIGIVHAGAHGRTDVFVWAGCFETPQVRIGNKLCYADENSTTCWRKGVLITLENYMPVIRENKFFNEQNRRV